MRQLRAIMQPIRTEGPSGRAIVGAFELDFSPFGRAVGPVIEQAPATLDVHADVDQNEVLDIPLLPLSLTHAIFHFVDGNGEPLKQMTASFQSSAGETLQSTTDDFGELYLDASKDQTYTLLEVPPADDDRVAIVKTSVNSRDSAVA